MKRILIAATLAIGLAVPVTGCALFQPADQSEQAIIIAADKALITAHTVYKAAGDTLIVLANSGFIKGETARTARAYYDTAGEYLAKADQAHDIGNAVVERDMAQAAIAAVALATTQKGN